MENKVFAKVKDREITNLEVEQILKTLPPQQAMYLNSEEGKKQIAKELVDQELFYLDAIDSDLESDEGFIKELEKLKEGLLKQYAVTKLIRDVKANDDEAKVYYENHKETFKTKEKASAKHILVDSEEKAKELYTKIISEEVTFEDCAKENSTCPSKNQGGDLGEFGRGQMVPEFEEAVFNMKKDEVAGPVKTQFGYHLIKLSNITESKTLSFDEVKEKIKQMLTKTKQQELFDSKLKELYLKYADLIKFEE